MTRKVETNNRGQKEIRRRTKMNTKNGRPKKQRQIENKKHGTRM